MSNNPTPKPAKFEELSHYEKIPSPKDGEFPFHDSQLADVNELSFSEASRSPNDGDDSRSQGKFRTTDSTKRS